MCLLVHTCGRFSDPPRCVQVACGQVAVLRVCSTDAHSTWEFHFFTPSPTVAVTDFDFCPSGGCEIGSCCFNLPAHWWGWALHRPPGMVLDSLSQLVALKKTETSKCCFLAYDVNFSREKWWVSHRVYCKLLWRPWSCYWYDSLMKKIWFQ